MNAKPIVLIAALLLTLAPALDAQVRRGRQAPDSDGTPWAPIAIGLRVGWDQEAQGQLLGAQLRIPVVRSGLVELVPNAEMIFLDGTKEYQYNLEAAVIPGRSRGGLFGIAGIGWRNTVFATPPGGGEVIRDTYFGYLLGGGIKSGVGRLQLELSLRWLFLNDIDYTPNTAAIGLNLPLW